MHRFKYIQFFSIACVFMMLFSCNDYLTNDPDNKTIIEGYYNSAVRINQGVTGVYDEMRKALLANYGWVMYGEGRDSLLQVDEDYYSYVASQNLTADVDELVQLTDWEYFYDVIYAANQILDVVEDVDEGVLSDYQYNLFKGECLALKSLAYFYLARIWGDVPSAEDADFGVLLDETEVVGRSLSYATEADPLLPWMLLNDDGIESSALTEVRFSKTAIKILMAQEDLWLGNNADANNILFDSFTADVLSDSISGFGLSYGEDERVDIPTDPFESAVTISIDKLDELFPEEDSRRSSMFNISDDKATLIADDDDVLTLFSKDNLYLLFAESAWRNNDLESAIGYLTEVSSGATEDYSVLTDDDFEDALLLERERLLIGTGQRFFDLMRFGKVSDEIDVFSDEDVNNGASYWPLSQSSLDDNSLTQNSYWSN